MRRSVPEDGRESHQFAAFDNAALPCEFAEVAGHLAIMLGRFNDDSGHSPGIYGVWAECQTGLPAR